MDYNGLTKEEHKYGVIMKKINAFYFNHINDIGGVESFFYYLSKQYKNMVVYYRTGNPEQIRRLSKNIEVIKYNGQRIKVDRLFVNYDTSIVDYIEADEYIQIIHADYKAQPELLKGINPKITKYIGVSQAVCDNFEEMTKIKPELIYNPIEIDKPKKLLKLIIATRLTKEKGRDRMEKLGQLLNNKGIPYIWLVFTNSTNYIENPNIIYMKPQLDITTYMNEADFLVQLSDCEAYCFSVVENLLLSKPVIVTDLPVYKEIGLNDSNSIKLNLDFEDIDEEKLFKQYSFMYKPPKSEWGKYIDSNSNYNPSEKVLVKAIRSYRDLELGRTILKDKDEPYYITKMRATYLIEKGLVKEVKE